jgi:hypothetical protein
VFDDEPPPIDPEINEDLIRDILKDLRLESGC